MDRVLTNLSLKSVIIGLMVSWFGSVLTIVIIGSIVGLLLSGAVGADAFDYSLSWQFFFIYFLVSLLFAAMGGQVAAKIAAKGIYLNSGLVGVVLALIGFATIEEQHAWYSVSIAVLSVPAALAGGWNTISDVKVENV